ncbi:ABC transporter [Clostridiaceae bacterium 14S0207]|nr:ABC transporter [Clostridiaceae bacterium 14S0207]
MIKVNDLKKSFKKVDAVKGISFEVNNGEIVGLLGENGAGKTTTLRMLATMIKPTGGDATINGNSIIKNSSKVRGDIGILFGGDVGLYDRLTAKENIEYFAELNGMDKKAREESIKNLTEIFDMGEYINRRVGKFSRGMKQKVSISRSIVHNPSVMLFDEPTTGLDVTSSKIVQEFILRCKKQNKAILFSSHSMQEVERLCDRVIIIHKGEIVEEGTIEGLKEKYKENDMEEIFMRLVGGK